MSKHVLNFSDFGLSDEKMAFNITQCISLWMFGKWDFFQSLEQLWQTDVHVDGWVSAETVWHISHLVCCLSHCATAA